MYFSETNKINYNGYNIIDITKRTNIIQELIKNKDFYFEYVLKSGDTPESVAYDFYSDTELYWILILVNEIYDPLYEWYMTYNEVVDYSKLKYGDPQYQQTQYWLFNNVKYKIQPNITIDPNGLAVAISNLDVEIERNDNNQQIRVVYPEYINQIVREYKSLV